MSATSTPPPSAGLPLLLWQQVRRIGPLGTIILLHIAFFYALQSGLIREASQAIPKEIIATFVTPERPQPPQPQPQPKAPEPKSVPVVKKAVTPPPRPVVETPPSPQAITTPPAPAAPAEPAAPAAVAAPVPTAPAAPPAPAQPRTITSGIEYLQQPQAVYPPISRRMGEEGKAVLRVLVNEKGRPERVELQKSSGSARLDEAARQAVLRALFKPFIEDGRAVPAFAIVPINFQLE